MKKITNIDTFSALVDRLIVENIKLFFFKKDEKTELIVHQLEIIHQIKQRINETMQLCFDEQGYDFIDEKRTFNVNDLTINLEELITNNCHIGESDRSRLNETKQVNPNIETFIIQERRLRVANEGRSKNKNKIDELFKKLFGGLTWVKK